MTKIKLLLAGLVFACVPTTPLWADDGDDLVQLPDPITPYVSDFANLIDPETEARINAELVQLQRDLDIQIAVVTIESRHDYGQWDQFYKLSNTLFNQWEIGNGQRNDGILILIGRSDRTMRIELGAAYGPIIENRMQQVIDNNFIPYFKGDQYAAGIEAGTREIINRLQPNFDITAPPAQQKPDPKDITQPAPAPEPVDIAQQPAPAPEPVDIAQQPDPAPEPVDIAQQPDPVAEPVDIAQPDPIPQPEDTTAVLYLKQTPQVEFSTLTAPASDLNLWDIIKRNVFFQWIQNKLGLFVFLGVLLFLALEARMRTILVGLAPCPNCRQRQLNRRRVIDRHPTETEYGQEHIYISCTNCEFHAHHVENIPPSPARDKRFMPPLKEA